MKKLLSIVCLLLLSSCMTPTMRVPSTSHIDMDKTRRNLLREAINKQRKTEQHLQTLYYGIKKSTGQELCNKKLTPDIGLGYKKFQKWGIWLFASSADKQKLEDYKKIYGVNIDELFVDYVVKGSAADIAGIKKGDIITSFYGITPPTSKNFADDIKEILAKNHAEDLEVEIEVLRKGVPINFVFQADMVCDYPLSIDKSDSATNAYATGEEIIITQNMLDKLKGKDLVLSAILAHELSHNTLGHTQSKQINMLGAFALGTVSDIFLGTNTADSAMYYGSLLYSQEFETEADTLGTYYLARAGYDYKKAADVGKFLTSLNYEGLYTDASTHPQHHARYAVISEVIKEIDIKKAFDEPLEPDFKKKNIFLKGKK